MRWSAVVRRATLAGGPFLSLRGEQGRGLTVDIHRSISHTFDMEIHLTPHQEAFLEQRVDSGIYASTDAAVQAAISLLEDQDIALRKSSPTQTRKSLAQLFAESPFRGLEIDFARDRAAIRDAEL